MEPEFPTFKSVKKEQPGRERERGVMIGGFVGGGERERLARWGWKVVAPGKTTI